MLVQEPVAVFDYTQETRFVVPEIVAEHAIRSGLGVPIKQADGLDGVIIVQTTKLRDFNRAEIYFLEMLADQVSLAIQRAQHYESLQAMQGLLAGRTAVAWMGLVSSTWNHRIAGHINTIGAIIESMQAIADLPGSNKDIPVWVREKLKTMERIVQQIKHSPLALPAAAEANQLVPVNNLISRRLKELWQDPAYDYRRVLLKTRLEPQAKWLVRISPEWLARALEILVDNAVKAVKHLPRAQCCIGVQTRMIDGYVEIVVSDSGPGIPPDVQESLFCRRKDSTAGLGMGLLIAQVIAEQNGGRILLGKTDETGTEMILQLPLITDRPATSEGGAEPFEHK